MREHTPPERGSSINCHERRVRRETRPNVLVALGDLTCFLIMLAPSDYRFFEPLKDDLCGHHFQNVIQVQQAMQKWVRKLDEAFTVMIY